MQGKKSSPAFPKEPSVQQLSLVFEPGLASRSRSLREHLGVRMYAYGLADVANLIDCSRSHLTEKIAGADTSGKPRNLNVDDLEAYIAGSGDLSPIHYLIDKFMRDPTAVQAEAMAALAKIAEQLPALMAAAGCSTKPGRARR